MPPWVSIVTGIFYLFPSFQFGKLFMDITNVTCFHFDPENLNWVESERSFEWNDLFVRKSGVFFTKDRYEIDSMIETGMTFVYLMAAHSILAWYFDNTLPSNRGVPKSWDFFLKPSFWFPSIFGTYKSIED